MNIKILSCFLGSSLLLSAAPVNAEKVQLAKNCQKSIDVDGWKPIVPKVGPDNESLSWREFSKHPQGKDKATMSLHIDAHKKYSTALNTVFSTKPHVLSSEEKRELIGINRKLTDCCIRGSACTRRINSNLAIYNAYRQSKRVRESLSSKVFEDRKSVECYAAYLNGGVLTQICLSASGISLSAAEEEFNALLNTIH